MDKAEWELNVVRGAAAIEQAMAVCAEAQHTIALSRNVRHVAVLRRALAAKKHPECASIR